MTDETKLTRYEVGFHSSSDEFCHVTKINPDAPDNSNAYATGDAVDLFDVSLYDSEVTETNGRSARDNSLAALEELVRLANIGAERETFLRQHAETTKSADGSTDLKRFTVEAIVYAPTLAHAEYLAGQSDIYFDAARVVGA